MTKHHAFGIAKRILLALPITLLLYKVLSYVMPVILFLFCVWLADNLRDAIVCAWRQRKMPPHC